MESIYLMMKPNPSDTYYFILQNSSQFYISTEVSREISIRLWCCHALWSRGSQRGPGVAMLGLPPPPSPFPHRALHFSLWLHNIVLICKNPIYSRLLEEHLLQKSQRLCTCSQHSWEYLHRNRSLQCST